MTAKHCTRCGGCRNESDAAADGRPPPAAGPSLPLCSSRGSQQPSVSAPPSAAQKARSPDQCLSPTLSGRNRGISEKSLSKEKQNKPNVLSVLQAGRRQQAEHDGRTNELERICLDVVPSAACAELCFCV